MNITISPITNNNRTFRATKKDETNVIAKKNKKPLTHQQLAEKRTKIALGCCLAAFVAVDILYFATKRNIKYGKIDKKRMHKLSKTLENRPRTVLELFEENKEKFGENALTRFRQIITNKRR